MTYNLQIDNIQANVKLLLTKVNKIMTSLDDLNTAVTTLQANFVTLDTAIQNEIALLKAALLADNSVAVETAATNISAVSAKMATDAQALTPVTTP